MDRRQFIQGATALGASAALPVAASGAASAGSVHVCPRYAVITVGSIGRAVFDHPVSNLPYRPRTIAINTNAASLGLTHADGRILLGDGVEPPHSPEDAAHLAHAAIQYIADGVTGFDVVFLVAGMGGATGTGISPVVAQILRGNEVMTLACAITPFDWEAERRRQVAAEGVRALRPQVDALIRVSNERYAGAAGEDLLLSSVLEKAPLEFWRCYRRATDLAIARTTGHKWRESRQELKGLWV